MVSSNGRLALMCVSLAQLGMSAPDARRALSCVPHPEGLEVSWDADVNADRYDLSMGVLGVSGTEDDIAGHHTKGNETRVIVKYLIPGHKYWFQLVAHSRGHDIHSGWKPVSEKHECVAPLDEVEASGESLSSTRRRRRSTRRRGYFVKNMVRMHPHYDGLTNHNSADAKGEANLLNWWRVGQTCLLAGYKVHIKAEHFSGQVTPKGDKHYANYMSCNEAAGQPGGYTCTGILNGDCGVLGISSQCTQAQNIEKSKDYVGMGVLAGNGGRWYSTPYAGEHKTWHRDSQYRKAKCHKGMSESDIKKALGLSADSVYLQPWEDDEDHEANETHAQLTLSSASAPVLV